MNLQDTIYTRDAQMFLLAGWIGEFLTSRHGGRIDIF